MPLIDDIGAVPFSTQKQFTTVKSEPAPGSTFCGDTIEALRTALLAAGWNQLQALRPAGRIVYPFGFPATSAMGSGVVGCGASWVVITTALKSYRYSSYILGQSTSGGDCSQFPLASTPGGSLANLAMAITLTSPYTATLTLQPDGITYVIDLVAKVAGPPSNYDSVVGDGRFGIGSGAIVGGGYQFESVGSSYYQVTITGQIGVAGEQVIGFGVNLGPGGSTQTVSYFVGTNSVAEFSIAANPYSFAMFDGVNPVHSIAVLSPDISTAEGFTSAYAVAIVGPGNLTSEIMWDGNTGPTTTSLDGFPSTFGDDFDGPGVLCLRGMAGIPLYTLDGRPLSIAAYLFMGAGPLRAGHSPFVIGKLWDCAVITDAVEVGGFYTLGGRAWVCIASQNGSGSRARASLLFCINDNGL